MADAFANCHLYYQAETWDPISSSTLAQLSTARSQAYRITWMDLITADLQWITNLTTASDDPQRHWDISRWVEYAHDAPKQLKTN
eukprot:4518871-Pyramimonas_sp.AAC.1